MVLISLVIWLIGIILSIVSRYCFGNDNTLLWCITRKYNELISIMTLLYVPTASIIYALKRRKNFYLFLCITVISSIAYLISWVFFSGGL
mgnify:FL=1